MAPVAFLETFMVTPGKFVVLVHGDPTSVQAALDAGRAVAGGALLDWLHIPFVDPQVLPALQSETRLEPETSLGLVETTSVASGIVAADAAAKAAAVQLVHLHLGRGIGGKSMLLLCGVLPDVQAAVAAAAERAQAAGRLVATRVIAQPHPELTARLSGGLQRLAVPAIAAPRRASAPPSAPQPPAPPPADPGAA
jgi:microcompartment protein CcmL/EutN